jgi:hypothetical protein
MLRKSIDPPVRIRPLPLPFKAESFVLLWNHYTLQLIHKIYDYRSFIMMGVKQNACFLILSSKLAFQFSCIMSVISIPHSKYVPITS